MDRVDVEQWKGREVARLLALVETERRYYQEIVASLPVGLAVVSRDRVIQSANRAFRQMFGLRAEDIRRRTLEQILPSAELNPDIEETLASGVAKSGVTIETGAGPEAPRRLRASLMPIRDWDEDTELEVLLVLEDLSAVALPPSTSDAPALIWTAQAEAFAFTAAGGSAEAVLAHPGFTPEAMHPEDRDATLQFYREAFENPGRHACEYRALGAGGEVLWYRDAFCVNAGTDARAGSAAGVVTDITERKAAEQMAIGANRLDALAGLSRTLTHELNNPLMIVTGYGEDLLASLGEADPRRGDMEEILTAAQRMAGLSNQLLTFTRKQAHATEPVRVAEAIARAVEPENIETHVPADIRAMAEPVQLEEALRALIARLRRDGRVSIEGKSTSFREQVAEGLAPGDYVELIFSGAGGAPVSFDALLPAKDPLGPDLAQAHAIIREWNGGIWQAGHQVRLLLPAAAPATVTLPVAEAPVAEPEPAAAPEPQLETILVVEDEGGIRALVRKILRRQQYEVLEAGTPDEAVAIAQAHPGKIQLLITDMTLPQRNGRVLAEELAGILPDLKVLFVSGYTDDASIADGELPHGAAFLQKPFTLGSLLKKVRDVLDQ